MQAVNQMANLRCTALHQHEYPEKKARRCSGFPIKNNFPAQSGFRSHVQYGVQWTMYRIEWSVLDICTCTDLYMESSLLAWMLAGS